jgi:iron(III) transport system substrate-binding protein
MGKRSFLVCVGLSFLFLLGLIDSASAQIDWKKEWEKTVEAARKEGEVTVYHTTGPFDSLFREFQKLYPEIKVTGVTGRGNQLAPRIMAERRAGKYLADLYLGAVGTPFRVFHPAKILEPISPFLILPEVIDNSRWFHGQHHYADPERRYIFVFEGSVRSDVAYNMKQVEPKEFRSYWDFVNPKWKGKMVAMDPKQGGIATGSSLSFFYYNQELGPEFLRRLFGEMDVTFSRDTRQLVDWLALGKFSIAFFATRAEDAIRQGLPVERFPPTTFKEGVYIRPQQGSISLISQAPHPNAAKVLTNWLLSRDGQIHFQKIFSEQDPTTSLREDVPKDHVPSAYRLVTGQKFLPAYRPEYVDIKPALKVIEEAVATKK